jgi:hypothetical protein
MGGDASSGDYTGKPELPENRVSQGRPSGALSHHRLTMTRRAIPIRNVSTSDRQHPEKSRKCVSFSRNLYTFTPCEAPGATRSDGGLCPPKIGDWGLRNRSEVVREGLRLLKQRDEVWKADVRARIKQGMDSIRAGRAIPQKSIKTEPK